MEALLVRNCRDVDSLEIITRQRGDYVGYILSKRVLELRLLSVIGFLFFKCKKEKVKLIEDLYFFFL